MSHSVSPLALPFPDLPTIAGVTPRVARARYKDWDRCDLSLVELALGTAVAGVTTTSKCPSPEVEWCRGALPQGHARALVVSAGNANAFTGGKGRAAVQMVIDTVSAHLDCAADEVFVSATGVIGVPLPQDKARAGLEAAFTASPCGWRDLTDAIGTTD
ncbi:MAG: bifunctional ornithine acetyltransferase/N-acetylglutamate synthase, partial [Blastomonas sp.]|nr:bifunctional ornithine acetyltransferase/N-acetylglutamate synthase [Blastomonas sp.]